MKTITPVQIKKIRSLYGKGLTERAIAKQVGCSRSGVWHHLKKVKNA